MNTPIPTAIAKDIKGKQKIILDFFRTIAPDLQGINTWRYQRQISAAHQEHVEALSFQQYLESQKLLSLEDTSKSMPTDALATEAEDHILGLFDLTGEMMRFAITYSASNGALPGTDGATILTDLQLLRGYFEQLEVGNNSLLARDFEQKMKTMRSSVEKVENAAYSLIVRGSERPKGWVPALPEDHKGFGEAVK